MCQRSTLYLLCTTSAKAHALVPTPTAAAAAVLTPLAQETRSQRDVVPLTLVSAAVSLTAVSAPVLSGIPHTAQSTALTLSALASTLQLPHVPTTLPPICGLSAPLLTPHANLPAFTLVADLTLSVLPLA